MDFYYTQVIKEIDETLSITEKDSEGHPIVHFTFNEVKEFWGFLSTEEMQSLGVDVPEDQLGLEFAANIWTIGPVIIKGIISPLKDVTFPYHFYYYEKDDTSIFGEGIPCIMRDVQILVNASIRAMLDNEMHLLPIN